MKLSILRARYALEMDVDLERQLGVTNIDYDRDEEGKIQGCTIYTEETFTEPDNSTMGGAVYYIVLDRELLEAIAGERELWDDPTYTELQKVLNQEV